MQANRSFGDHTQDAVGPETDPGLGFIGFEVDVGRAAADGIGQLLVDEFDHRGIVGAVVGFVVAEIVIAADGLEVDQLVIAAVIEGVGRIVVGQFERLAQRVFGDHHRLHDGVAGEFHRIQGVAVGRVGNGYEQLAAMPLQGQHLLFIGEFFGNQGDQGLAQVHRRQVEQGQAELQ